MFYENDYVKDVNKNTCVTCLHHRPFQKYNGCIVRGELIIRYSKAKPEGICPINQYKQKMIIGGVWK
ncbi:hypothetical protein [uncultured Arcobacter sp.]|uniref:hypothetical protein n=1 Tax=uncultured Arcobacter sp. TaxID=165434 RepID=UPI002637ACBF|nr:hypothetical protein [uncultured Arcobacter sp.]